MKLLELTGYNSLRGLSVEDLALKFKAELGRYGFVILSDNAAYKFWAEDSGYEGWMKIIEGAQGNPWVPKILKPAHKLTLPKHVLNGATLNTVKLEKLTSHKTFEKSESYRASLAEALLISRKPTKEFCDALMKEKRVRQHWANDIHDMRHADIEDMVEDEPNFVYSMMKDFGWDVKGFCQIVPVIEATVHFPVTTLDIHAANIMWRDMHPVITDPFTGNNSVTIKQFTMGYR